MKKIIIENNEIFKYIFFLFFFIIVFYFYYKNNKLKNLKNRSLYGKSLQLKMYILIIIGVIASVFYIIKELMCVK